MWKELLKKIEEIEKNYGESLARPLSPDVISKTNGDISPEVKSFLKEEYSQFLAITNGLDFNGSVLYGMKQTESDSEQVHDIFLMNNIWHEVEEQRQYFFIGENNISWFVYHPITGNFYELDMPSGDVIERYSHLDELLDNFFEQALE